MKKFLCICLSATLQKTVNFEGLELEKVNRSKSYRFDASGKAVNSARVLTELESGCAKVLCPVGVENSDLFLKLVQRDNLDIAYVPVPGFTRECLTLLDRGNGTTTELVISEPSLSDSDLKQVQSAEIKLLKFLNDILPSIDGVILAGSKPGCWSDDLYAAICGIVKDAGKVFLADYIGADLIKTINDAAPNIIKINDEEFCKTFGFDFPIDDEKLKEEICKKSREMGNIIVITRGVRSTFGAKCGDFAECDVERVLAVNTTACGDSFNAGFMYEYLNSGDFEGALKKGTWCAARNAEVEVPGSIKNSNFR